MQIPTLFDSRKFEAKSIYSFNSISTFLWYYAHFKIQISNALTICHLWNTPNTPKNATDVNFGA